MGCLWLICHLASFLLSLLFIKLLNLRFINTGSVCTTRRQTGVGYPQLSAVLECADAAHGLKGHIISVSITPVLSIHISGSWGLKVYCPESDGNTISLDFVMLFGLQHTHT